MALYTNSNGKQVNVHSYSGGSTYEFCPTKYYHQRVGGWKEKEEHAYFAFGIAIGDAIRYFHEHQLSGGVECFEKLWSVHKMNLNLAYTEKEGSWEDLNKSGQEMIRLYALNLPRLPIDLYHVPIFERKYSKEVFPGTELAGIEFVAYPDMICHTPRSANKLILDIKTSGALLDSTPNILSLDQQLRSYAWLTGIPNVGFINLVKVSRSLKTGTVVTLLEGVQDLKAGSEAVIAKIYDPEEDVALVQPAPYTILTADEYEAMNVEIGDKPQSKQGKLNKTTFLARVGRNVHESAFTKQKFQFLTAYIDDEAQQEVAKQIGHDVAQIYHSNQDSFWPKKGGVRYPNNKCVTCSMRGLCLGNAQLRDELLVRIDGVFGEDEKD